MSQKNISVTLNGVEREVPDGTTLQELLSTLGIQSLVGFACERNGEILPPHEAPSTLLSHGDDLVLVRMVGGG